jgi:hypothetical protein
MQNIIPSPPPPALSAPHRPRWSASGRLAPRVIIGPGVRLEGKDLAAFIAAALRGGPGLAN